VPLPCANEKRQHKKKFLKIKGSRDKKNFLIIFFEKLAQSTNHCGFLINKFYYVLAQVSTIYSVFSQALPSVGVNRSER
jgi:hypothetical protein